MTLAEPHNRVESAVLRGLTRDSAVVRGLARDSAVIRGLARSWSHRATVKKAEPDLDDLFDLGKRDYPNALLPFADHDTFRGLDTDQQDRLRSWAWIAFNKNVMDVEEYVVNPGFDLIAHDGLDSGIGETMALAVHQAMVDEQYHTLMHLNASAVMRRRRGWPMPNKALPDVRTVRRQHEVTSSEPDPRRRAIDTLAYMTVAEISISAYLDLISEDEAIQPVNRATVALHNRDERAHATIADDIAGVVYDTLSEPERDLYLAGLVDAMTAFAGNDFAAWHRIVELERVPGGRAMIDDAAHDGGHRNLVQDFTGIRKLCNHVGAADRIQCDWT
ncbi:MAG: diiron oxygenase [Rhodococcus sp.]|nr:diiron oxygenase [Rhodococcus sp. (in: high G+C Gram-positive bacteria)]